MKRPQNINFKSFNYSFLRGNKNQVWIWVQIQILNFHGLWQIWILGFPVFVHQTTTSTSDTQKHGCVWEKVKLYSLLVLMSPFWYIPKLYQPLNMLFDSTDIIYFF